MSIYLDHIKSSSLPNKYTNWYISIISSALKRSSIEGYKEKHHILPRCLCNESYQVKDKNNIVHLTAREHFVCHWLLCKIFSEGNIKLKMFNAFTAFFMDKTRKRNLSSHQFEIIRKYYASESSKRNKGKSCNKGIPKSEEHKSNLSISRKNSQAFKTASIANAKKASEFNTGRKRPDHSKFMSEYNTVYYKTPLGTVSNKDKNSPLPLDLIKHWCRHPNRAISKHAQTTILKNHNILIPNEWIGKTTIELGFIKLGRDVVTK